MTSVVTDFDSRIKEIVCRVLELEPDEVQETSHFSDDLGADSMSAIELLAALEREFDVEIAQDDMIRLIDLPGVRSVVTEALEA
jgi:acyl carrier protein